MDIFSRIILQAQGGDQAARELEKVKRAADEAGKSMKGMAVGGIGVPATADPFAEATRRATAAPAMTGGGPSPTPGFSKDPMDGARQRIAEHQMLTGRTAQQLAGGATGAGTALARGDVAGAAGGAISGAAGFLGAAAPWLLAGGMLIKGVGALAGNEYERVQQMWQSGLAQQTGGGYENLRNQMIGMARKGIPSENTMAMTQALMAAGGRMTGEWEPMAQRMTRWGADAQATGNIMATMQRLGFQGGVSDTTMGTLGAAFGRGRVSPALQGITQILEDAMARGADRAGEMLSQGTLGVANRLAGYAGAGLSMEGAIGLYRQLDQTYAGASNLRTPMDVMTFRTMRKPGESMFETMLRMEKDTERTGRTEYEMLKERYGGNLDTVKTVLMRGRGLTAAQAEAYVGVREGTMPPPPVAAPPPSDEFAQAFTRMKQYQALQGAEDEMAKLLVGVFDFFRAIGERARETPGAATGFEEAAKAFQETRGALPTGPKSQTQLMMEYGAAVQQGNQVRANELLEQINGTMRSIDNKLSGVATDEGTTE